MSNPPSPSRRPPAHRLASTSSEQQPPSHPTTSATTSMYGVAIAAPTLGLPFYEPIPRPPPGYRPSAPFQEPLPPLQAAPARYGVAAPPVQSGPTLASAPRPSSSKGGRKSKAHVASACINCKRAHLSCDVNRPCGRCVASGKQDTCIDVQHKKRGRPRLREETEFKVEQMLPEPGPSTAMAVGGAEAQGRVMAAPRHGRTESYRSLRSQCSDGSGVPPSPTFPFPPPPTATQTTFGVQQPPSAPSPGAPGYEVPTAYLDLDLVFLKANQPYRQIMIGGQDVVGRQLSDIAAAMDGESFANIRSRLRTEREARDPSYMPPINPPGQDPLQGASEADVERYTQGFDDRTYTWTQTQVGQSAQSFPARVRLAKANSYFVAVTLPTFRPIEQIPPHAPPPQYARRPHSSSMHTPRPESYRSPARHVATHSAPSSITGYGPFPGGQILSVGPRPSSQQSTTRAYLPPQPMLSAPQQQPYPSHQSGPSGTPRLPVAEPPTETTAFTPRSAPRELPQSSSAGPQLPPIVESPAPRPSREQQQPIAGPSTSRAATTEPPGETSASEDAPRKRRRLGLDDVLHR
ncbi:hypothetical protein AC578_9363 [Lecanosticta acicola]|uniref:Zn(2)-C6 fungal-type domain-containing protein n=1 Tax=Lecanosticta acicola TaxID=111012 RepID=A0AAI8Z2P7_9PEZI|nr:hypothetical protein AC578_9363 [Lecanosticta acicola]